MKKIKRLLIIIGLIFLLTGCSLLDFLEPTNKTNEPTIEETNNEETIDSFEIITDDKMVIKESGTTKYYNLVMYAGEEYQIKTTIDDKLGDTYYLKYTSDDDINDKITISEKGYIKVISDIKDNETIMIDVELYKKGVSKKITYKYFALSLMVGEYANITLTDENLTFDESTYTYTLSLNSGESYYISYKTITNTSFVISYALTKAEYKEFMDVDQNGKITTSKTSEDKIGKVSITLTGSNGILNEVYLVINLNKTEEALDEFIVKTNNKIIEDNDTLDLMVNDEVTFDIKYNNVKVTDVISVSDTTILEVEENIIKAIKVGTCKLTFKYENHTLTITINVKKDEMVSISSDNEGDDFLIVNNELNYLNNMYISYESGKIVEITDNSLIKVVINDKDDIYKTVTFSYEDLDVTYDVKYYNALEYEGDSTAYNFNDLYNNHVYGYASVLPNTEKVKLLVIPVWFNDSNKFFNESQKMQIIEDIEYTMNGNRPNTELYSVKQYYELQSYGAIQMDIKVSDFYSSDTSYQDYSDNLEDKVDNSHILATDAISWYFLNNPNESFNNYDLNNDGYLDGVVILYAANNYGAKGDNNNSYAFASVNTDANEYRYNTMCFCPIAGLYGLEKKEPTTQLMTLDLDQAFAKDFRSSSRTIIHEIGHMFGNKDLYEKGSSQDKYYPAGAFVMQSYNYGGHDPHQVNLIGWSKPSIYASSDYELGDEITIKLSEFQSTGQNIILTNTWNEANSLFDEYLILELFAPTGLNEFDSKVTYLNTMTSGIRVWHANSLLMDCSNYSNLTNEIIDGNLYDFGTSNYEVENKYDMLHLIRNNPNEDFNSTSRLPNKDILFNAGDSFDMETFKSQFMNGSKLDNEDKLGWEFKVNEIYKKADGSYDAIITLKRTDNVKTDFRKTVSLNLDNLKAPEGLEDYSTDIFGKNSEFTFTYKYVTPPSIFVQEYPISSNGMCLFASADGNGGYIEIKINDIEGKNVNITSISITYSTLTNASLTVISGGNTIDGISFNPSNTDLYGYTYNVNSNKIRIQNQYSETINHWSVLALFDITIEYTII